MDKNPLELFANDVFTDEEMKKRVSDKAYDDYKKTLEDGVPLGLSTADEVAKAMMGWAMEKGATHYTHWFQPLTDGTAEKHDSFIDFDKETVERIIDALFPQE